MLGLRLDVLLLSAGRIDAMFEAFEPVRVAAGDVRGETGEVGAEMIAS